MPNKSMNPHPQPQLALLPTPLPPSSAIAEMFASLVDINGNVDTPVEAQAREAAQQKEEQEPSLMMQLQEKLLQSPSDRLEDRILESFFEFGLVEVLLAQDDSLFWHDAYIIDVVAESSSESTAAKKEGSITPAVAPSKHICTVVLAIQGEDPNKTLTEAKNIQKCPLEQVRLKLKFDAQTAFSDNEMVQILKEESKPFVKWLPGKIVKVAKGDFFVVDVSGKQTDSSPPDATTAVHDLSKLDFVSKDYLRPQNSYYQLSEENNPFYRFDLPMSKDFLSCIRNNFKWLANYDLHKDFKKYIPQLINVFPDPEKKSLTCIAFFANGNLNFDKEQVIKRASMLSSMHFNSLKESFIFACQMGTIKPDEVIVPEKPKEFILRLPVEKKYIGLSIGKQGANIQKARKIDGILSLELDDSTSVFYIRGVSKEACDAAADILNFVEQILTYPIEYLQLFYDSKLMNEIVATSSVVRVELCEAHTSDNEIRFSVVGKPNTLEDFKLIFEFQKQDQDEISQFKYQHKMLMEKLCNMQGDIFMPKNFADAVKLGNKQ